MKNKYIISSLLIISLGLFAPHVVRAQGGPAPDVAGAQPDATAQPDQTPPSVARVSVAQGEVSTMRGDAGQWVASTVNAPLERGDKLSTGARSRAEIQLDSANVVRLDQQSEANIADLTRSRVQLQLAQGNINYTVYKGNEAAAEIDTPNVAVRPVGEGSYRIAVNSNGETEVTVRKGQAEVSTPQGSTTVQQGQVMVIQGTDNPQYQVNAAPGRDEFDDWSQKRDGQILNAQSWDHTNRNYTGTEDLDRYGHWSNVEGYGQVWSPDASADWTPYHDGRWAWEPYYGWTWVSSEPWGWAPYHYGRWFNQGNSWAWWPGPVYSGYYPEWSPAYVSFIGFGGGFGIGVGFGSIGWYPIGPCDSYYPWYGRGFDNEWREDRQGRFDNFRGNHIGRQAPPLAIGNRYPRISNSQSIYNNANVRRGITTVSAQNFGNGRVPRNTSIISATLLRQGQQVRGSIPVAPTRQSLSPTGRTVVGPASPGRANGAQTFFNRNQAPGGVRTLSAGGSANPLSPGASRPVAGATVRSGWQGFGQRGANTQPSFGAGSRAGGPITQNRTTVAPATRNAPSSSQAQQSGWQRFGSSSNQPGMRGQAPTVITRGGSSPTYSQPTPPAGRSGSQPFTNAPRQAVPIQRQAPATTGGWQRFNQHAPAQASPNYSAPRSQSAPSGWNRSSPTPASAPANRNGAQSGWNSPAPGSYNRPPLGMNKPIVSDRSSSGYGGGGPSVGGSYNGRNGSPAGGYSNGGNRGGSFGGSYSRSAPPASGGYSGGGYSRGAPPAPSGYNGGGGNRGAPSGGYSGGNSRGGGSYSGGGYSGGGSSRSSGGYSGGGGSSRSGGTGGGGGRSSGSSGNSRGGSSGDRSKH